MRKSSKELREDHGGSKQEGCYRYTLTGQHRALPLADFLLPPTGTLTSLQRHITTLLGASITVANDHCLPVVCRNKVRNTTLPRGLSFWGDCADQTLEIIKVTRPIGLDEVVQYNIRKNSNCESGSSETPHREFLPRRVLYRNRSPHLLWTPPTLAAVSRGYLEKLLVP